MRLLIVDDETDFANALAKGLRAQGYAVDIACDGPEACLEVEGNDYDLVLLDLNLPGMDGLEVCRQMRAARPQLLILMLTARGQPDERITGLDLGADDYLAKPFHFGELSARLRALLRRDLRVREPLLAFAGLALDPASMVAWRNRQRLDLTRKEFAVLHYLMRHQGEVVSQEELIEHVWGEMDALFTNTVRVHINSLRRKLDVGSATRYIETVVGAGYRLGPAGGEKD